MSHKAIPGFNRPLRLIFLVSFSRSILHAFVTMPPTTPRVHVPIPIVLRDLIDLKGFVDVDWLVPKVEVQKVLDEKAEEGSIHILEWRSAVKYAYDRYHFVEAEARFLMPRVHEINSNYGQPVKLRMRRWISDEMDQPLDLRFGITSYTHIDEPKARHGLVELVAKRAVREHWVTLMKRGIENKMDHPTWWGDDVNEAPEDEDEDDPPYVVYTL